MLRLEPVAMPWLDHVRAVPAIGVRLLGPPVSAHERLPHLRPLLASPRPRARDGKTLQVTMPVDNPWTLRLSGDGSGLEYVAEHGKAFVQFRHPEDFEVQPTGEIVHLSPTRDRIYSELMVDVVASTRAFLSALAGHPEQNVARVGVVATAQLAPDNLPPGIAQLFEDARKALATDAGCSLRFRRRLEPVAHGEVICVHRCNDDRDEAPFTVIHLDWQLTLSSPLSLGSSDFAEVLDSAVDEAQAYFERFGAGES